MTPVGGLRLGCGDRVESRAFLTDLLATKSVDPPDRSLPRWIAWWAATAGEAAWRTLPLSGRPPLTRMTVATVAQAMTFNDAKARREVGYEATVSRTSGLAELEAAADLA